MICMNAAATCHDLPLIRMHWASTQLSGHRVLILIGHRCPWLSVDLLPVASFVCVGMDHVLSWTVFWTFDSAPSRFTFRLLLHVIVAAHPRISNHVRTCWDGSALSGILTSDLGSNGACIACCWIAKSAAFRCGTLIYSPTPE